MNELTSEPMSERPRAASSRRTNRSWPAHRRTAPGTAGRTEAARTAPAPRRALRVAWLRPELDLAGRLHTAVGAAAVVLLAATAITGCAATGAIPPAAPAVSTPGQVGVPTRVEIPAIGVDGALVPVGLRADGAMETPAFGLAAWYEPGPRPGAAGPAVVLAHVDSTAGPDVFARLNELRPGDRVTVQREDGSSTFVVDSAEQVDKQHLPYDRIWGDTAEPVLRLITCGGSFDQSAGHYRDNLIVYAHLAAP